MKHVVVILAPLLGLLAACGGDGRVGDAAKSEPAATAAVPTPAPVESTPAQSVDQLLAAERSAFAAVAPPLHAAAVALIEEHRLQADHLGGGPVIVSLPNVGALMARSRQVEYGEPVIDRLDRDAGSISHPFIAQVLVTCAITTRESSVVKVQGSLVDWQPVAEPIADLPLPSAATDAPSLPESLRLAAAVAAAECLLADLHREAVVITLHFRFRLETGKWELDRERR